ncbi:MAG: hypothetical protein LCH61_04150 [Proteobacteria bacterium]|nr:hypothetical protein [Pseudomonadota bacterium]
MERELCDLTHQSLQPMDIGRLMCLSRIPVIAGDSFELNSSFLFRLNQLRRPLVLDIKMDVFVFFCPYRYAYPDWVSYIESGTKEAFTFPTISAGIHTQPWLCLNTAVYPRHIWADAARIWNYYFRDPSWAEISETSPIVDNASRRYGLKTAHLKSWGTAQALNADLTDSIYNLDSSAPTISVYDIQDRLNKAKGETFRDFVSQRYTEILKNMTGVEPSDYSDNVPELVWSESGWMSGFDINGTSGADLGASVGKAVGQVNLRMPRRLFSEHGTLYVFGLLRMPPVFIEAKQYLDDMNRPFQHIVPSSANLPPVKLTMEDVFEGGGAASLGYVPSYEWYRDHPSYIHYDMYGSDTGWQYLPKPASPSATIEVGNYDAMFQTLRNRHAIASCRHGVTAWRPLPSASGSVFGDL